MKTNKIVIVGTCFADKNAVITQGELLYDELIQRQYHAAIVSRHRNYLSRTFETVFAVLKLKKHDMVILQVYGTKSLYLVFITALMAKLKGCVIISTLHGGLIPDFYKKNPLKRALFNLLFRMSSVITVPSRFIKSRLSGPLKNAVLIRNMLPFMPVTPEAQRSHGTGIRILWMRAFQEVYNPLKAIEVFRLLRQKGFAVNMHMAGPDMGLLDLTLNEIAKHQLADEIVVHPALTQAEIAPIAAACNVYLCTNEVDNAPITFIEMMARGLPVVSTQVGGIPFLVSDRGNALLSEHNTAEELSELIIELYHNEALRNRIINKGKEEARKYTPSEVMKQWEDLLSRHHIKPHHPLP